MLILFLLGMTTGRLGFGFYTIQTRTRTQTQRLFGWQNKIHPTPVEFGFFNPNLNSQQEHAKLITCLNSARIHWFLFPFHDKIRTFKIILQQKTVKF
jgi:hypothetical protein